MSDQELTLAEAVNYAVEYYDAATSAAVCHVLAMCQGTRFERDYIVRLCNNVHMDVLNGKETL